MLNLCGLGQVVKNQDHHHDRSHGHSEETGRNTDEDKAKASPEVKH